MIYLQAKIRMPLLKNYLKIFLWFWSL